MRIDKWMIILFCGLLLGACSSSDEQGTETGSNDGKKIELSFSVSGYTLNTTGSNSSSADAVTRAGTDAGSDAEKEINNLYVFLFPTTGSQQLIKYYIDAASFSDGTWSTTDNKVVLNLTQAEVGTRDVYVVANCADLKTALDGVTTAGDLQSVFRQTAMPWSSALDAPILMAGHASHDFIADYHLDNVPLIRTLAKVELDVTLSSGFQVVPTVTGSSIEEYKYRYVDFDKDTYVLKPDTKTSDPVSSSSNDWPNTTDWTPWGSSLNASPVPDTGAGYTLTTDGKVNTLRVVTYINETDAAGSEIDIELPRADDGPLPPPEFGPELYKLFLPDKIVRNTWYRYDVGI
jgi:hypothetical protein